MIWDKSEPYLIYTPIFICEKQPIKVRHVHFCKHNHVDTFSLADETVVLNQKLLVRNEYLHIQERIGGYFAPVCDLAGYILLFKPASVM